VVEAEGNLRTLAEPYTANLQELMIGVARALADSVLPSEANEITRGSGGGAR
jgi:hypothetical protein